MDVDTALETVGGYKKYHLALFCLLSTSSMLPLCIQGLGFIFIGWVPPYHCSVPDGSHLNETIPVDEDGKLEKCLIYINGSDMNETEKCNNGWHYYSDGHETFVTEWDLVCSSDFLSDMSQMFYIFGCSFGDLVGSYFSDMFGRKKLHIVCNVILTILGSVVAFTPNYLSFVIVRIFCGMIAVVIANSGVTLLMEMFGSSKRAFAGIGLEFWWIPVYMLPCFIGYFVMEWRIQQFISSLLCLIWVIYIWIAEESVPWLVAKQRYTEAEAVLMRMAKYNGVKDISKIELERNTNNTEMIGPNEGLINKTTASNGAIPAKTPSSENQRNKVPISELFCDPKLRFHLILSTYFWFSNAMIYYGLTLITPSLGPNRFLSYIVMGLVELPCYVISLLVVNKFGRKKPQAIFFLIAGVPLVAAAFVPSTTASGVSLTPLMVTLVMIGKFGITGSFAIMILFARELFPTSLRSSSCAWSGIGGGLGSSLAPIASYMARHVFWLPNVTFGAVAILAAILTMPLPETMGKPLPQTTEELYVVYYNKTKPTNKNNLSN